MLGPASETLQASRHSHRISAWAKWLFLHGRHLQRENIVSYEMPRAGMLVVTLAGDRIRAMTRFDNSVIARFGLPRRLFSAD